VYGQEDAAKNIGNKYEINNWVSVNQYVTISLDEWLKLNDLVKKAICMEVESISRARSHSTKEQEHKLEQLMAEQNSALKFPSQTGSSINRFLS
jgi:hypothetical protein